MKIYRLKETKTSQLKKLYLNGNIDEDQFNAADNFFKTHSAYEKEVDWNKGLDITWEDLEKVIKKERNSKSQTKKKIRKGLEGFEEGKDYLILDEGIYDRESWVAYQPFSWEASRMIASHYVEPSENRYGETKAAEWCTSYQKNRTFWDTHNEIEAFIYICGESIPTKKVAVSISKEDRDASRSKFLYSLNDLNFNIWDFGDLNYTIEEDWLLESVPNLHDLIKKAYTNWVNKMATVILPGLKLDPSTNRYDYDGNISLSDKKLRHFISKNREGFTINFGIVTGNFDCSSLDLISLKGAPQEVYGNFDCSNNQLTSLKGSPQIVGKDFICAYNKIISLESAPRKVGRGFNCSTNRLTSLKGAPRTVKGDFDCSWNRLTSLERSPQKIKGNFNCSWNRFISLKGAPQIVAGDFDCSDNYITSLEGIGKVEGIIVKDF